MNSFDILLKILYPISPLKYSLNLVSSVSCTGIPLNKSPRFLYNSINILRNENPYKYGILIFTPLEYNTSITFLRKLSSIVYSLSSSTARIVPINGISISSGILYI